MKWIITVFVGLFSIVVASYLVGTRAKTTPQADPPAVEAAASPDSALVRLRADLASAPPVAVPTEADRFKEAMAWVRANRPADYAYADLEARVLVHLAVLFDGERQSAAWMLNLPQIEFEIVRAVDVDGDGLVSEAEVAAFNDAEVHLLGQLEHPYVLSRLDADGNGDLDDEERAPIDNKTLLREGAYARAIDRAQLDAWDNDGDGALSPEERTEGYDIALRARLGPTPEEQIAELLAAGQPEDEGTESLIALASTVVRAQYEEGRRVLEPKAMMDLAKPFFEAMKLESPEDAYVEQKPVRLSFDADGDGRLDRAESETYRAALDEYDNNRWWGSGSFARVRFNHAATLSDLNHDGRLTPNEWDARLDSLLRKRDDRLFLHSYDLDASGSVSSAELMSFLDWHKAGSLRADANYDGVLDARDLEHAMTAYQRQEQ